jgi:hypothetical protein
MYSVVATGNRNGIAMFAHAFQVKIDGLADQILGLLQRIRGDA